MDAFLLYSTPGEQISLRRTLKVLIPNEIFASERCRPGEGDERQQRMRSGWLERLVEGHAPRSHISHVELHEGANAAYQIRIDAQLVEIGSITVAQALLLFLREAIAI